MFEMKSLITKDGLLVGYSETNCESVMIQGVRLSESVYCGRLVYQIAFDSDADHFISKIGDYTYSYDGINYRVQRDMQFNARNTMFYLKAYPLKLREEFYSFLDSRVKEYAVC